jgi:hypothetical protein
MDLLDVPIAHPVPSVPKSTPTITAESLISVAHLVNPFEKLTGRTMRKKSLVTSPESGTLHFVTLKNPVAQAIGET